MPTAAEVTGAAGRWLRGAEAGAARDGGGAAVRDPVLLRHLIWTGVDTGLPLQFHAGFGDPDQRTPRGWRSWSGTRTPAGCTGSTGRDRREPAWPGGEVAAAMLAGHPAAVRRG